MLSRSENCLIILHFFFDLTQLVVLLFDHWDQLLNEKIFKARVSRSVLLYHLLDVI